MSQRVLIAIRTCGEIDGDGGGGHYGDEEGPAENGEAYELASGGSDDLNFEILNYSLAGSLQDNLSDDNGYGSEDEMRRHNPQQTNEEP